MKNRTEKIGKFRFKMTFGLDSGACREAGAAHPLSLNKLFSRAVFVLKDCQSVTPGLSVSSTARPVFLDELNRLHRDFSETNAIPRSGITKGESVYHEANEGFPGFQLLTFLAFNLTTAINFCQLKNGGIMEKIKN